MSQRARSTATQLSIRMTGRRRITAIALWAVIAAFAITLNLLSIPLSYAERLGQAYNLFSEALPNLGLTPSFYALYFPAVSLLLTALGTALGLFIVWRRSDEPMAVLVALLLVVSNSQNVTGFNVWEREFPPVGPLLVLSNAISYVLIFLNLLLFPDGHLYPRWSRFILVLVVPLTILDGVVAFGRPASNVLFATPFLIALGLLGFVALYVQRQRYLHHLTPMQRQQVKWVILGFFVANTPIILFNIVDPFITPWLIPRPEVRVLYRFAVHLFIIVLPFSAWTFSLAVSIFRYRLWDIDYAINRSLGYALVTLILIGVFLILFLILQSVITSPIALALLAIGVGLLFNPLRARVQRVIDKRLYGLRYAVDAVAAKGRSGGVQPGASVTVAPAIVQRGSFSGQTLGGYTLGDLVGRGGMGEVYKAHVGDRTLAIKVLPGMATEETRVRFIRESEILERLRHPNIVQSYEFGEQDGLRYLVMDYLGGTPLDKFIRAGGPLNLGMVRRILADITAALDYIHARGVVHRDLKPANIMLLTHPDGTLDRAVLMDFGIAKSQTTAITGTETMGTIDYMAPEQIQASGEVDARADIYALGVMLYEMLTGARPFAGNPGQVLFAHLRQPPPDLHRAQPNIPLNIVETVNRALSKTPDQRFAHAGDLAAALAA